jgi:hypothetical protein
METSNARELLASIMSARLSARGTGDWGMYSDEGNEKVAEIYVKSLLQPKNKWNYARKQLERLSKNPKFEEATDTEVRDRLFSALLEKE